MLQASEICGEGFVLSYSINPGRTDELNVSSGELSLSDVIRIIRFLINYLSAVDIE